MSVLFANNARAECTMTENNSQGRSKVAESLFNKIFGQRTLIYFNCV